MDHGRFLTILVSLLVVMVVCWVMGAYAAVLAIMAGIVVIACWTGHNMSDDDHDLPTS